MNNRKNDIFLYVMVASWNAYKYLDRCLDSILSQSYRNFKVLFIDDASGYTGKQRQYISIKLRDHLIRFNRERKYLVRNIYEMLHAHALNSDAVVVNVDGDDWLAGKDVFQYIVQTYRRTQCLLTYGDCYIWDGSKMTERSASPERKYTNVPYSDQVVRKSSYRKELFLPLHLLTWKAGLFKAVPKSNFQDSTGKWLRYCVDLAMYFPMLEMAKGRYFVSDQLLYVYNNESQYNAIKVNPLEVVKDELIIRKKPACQRGF